MRDDVQGREAVEDAADDRPQPLQRDLLVPVLARSPRMRLASSSSGRSL